MRLVSFLFTSCFVLVCVLVCVLVAFLFASCCVLVCTLVCVLVCVHVFILVYIFILVLLLVSFRLCVKKNLFEFCFKFYLGTFGLLENLGGLGFCRPLNFSYLFVWLLNELPKCLLNLDQWNRLSEKQSIILDEFWKRKQKKKGVWIFEHEFEVVRGLLFWQKSVI